MEKKKRKVRGVHLWKVQFITMTLILVKEEKKKKKKIVSCTYKNKVLLSRIYIYDYYRCHGVSGLHVYHFSMFF